MGIKVDVSQIDGFQAKIKALNGIQRDTFFRTACSDLGNRLIALVKPRTPVKTGVLRNNWNNAAGSLGMASVSVGANGSYSVTIENHTPYASYVELGHRQTPGRYVPAIGKRLKASWVEGTHMLQLSEADLNGIAPTVLQAKLDAFLRTVF